ncbi:hypothetical protein, partial [Belnapia mucosa]|uniref:hypothetical protein n=1 Tax=Belnapia mucosa TaxID=2804532 RepID=UPI001F3DA11C
APPRQRQRITPDKAEFVVCKQTIYGTMRAFLRDGVWESIRHHIVVMLREVWGTNQARLRPSSTPKV